MKKKYLLLFILYSITSTLSAQILAPAQGGEHIFETTSCISDSERNKVELQLQKNISQLKDEGILNDGLLKNAIVSFDWPLRKTANLDFNSYYAISNYVDQDQSNGLLDYNCDARTYNGHKGTDIFSWPFSWYMYDNDFVEIIAAAPGTIVAKNEGEFDQQCALDNTATANYVVVQHSDGSLAYYLHMKQGSVTTKALGQTVAVGEYLGVIASSGYSNGPHLHFEVRDNLGNIIDPYQGGCNSLNTQTWWTAQQPNRVPTLNALLTHSAPPVIDCPAANESPNLSDCFSANDTVYVALYFRDEIPGAATNLRIRRPDNSISVNWTHNSTNTYNSSYWYWPAPLPAGGPYGVWKFEADFDGQTYVREFTYHDGTTPNCLSCASVDLSITFDGAPTQTSWEITDAAGGTVASSGGNAYNASLANSNLGLPDISCLPDGCYDLTFFDAGNDGMCPRRTTTVLTGINIATLGLGGVFNGSPRLAQTCGDYTLTDANGTVLASGGGRFGTSETSNFCISGGIAALVQPNNDWNITSNNKVIDLQILPNLVIDEMTVIYSLEEMVDAELHIIDINGKTLQQHTQSAGGTQEIRLNVNELASGFYFLQLVSGNTIVTKKFVKQ